MQIKNNGPFISFSFNNLACLSKSPKYLVNARFTTADLIIIFDINQLVHISPLLVFLATSE